MKLMGPSPVHDDEGLEQDWLNFVQDNPLPDVLNFYDYDHIKAQFDGQAGRSDDEQEANEKPKAHKGRVQAVDNETDDAPRAARKVPFDTDDDEESKPAPRAARKPLAKEADDEQDEDETPPPRRGRGQSNKDEDDETNVRRAARPRLAVDDDNDGDDVGDDGSDDDDDAAPPSRTNSADAGGRASSLRDKLAARRRSLQS
jgi:hypothetical protein